MIIETGRFGQLKINEPETIQIPKGLFGFPEYTEFCVVDPGDDTLILWLQSLKSAEVVFPVLEPKIFKPDYVVNLSAADMRELKLENLQNAAVFSIITIPEDVTEMHANLKAPLVINLEEKVGKQVVLQENEYGIGHEMFKELRQHLMTIEAHQKGHSERGALEIDSLTPSSALKVLG